MNAAENKPKRNEVKAEKERLRTAVRDWVAVNKKLFWKYEVACFYRTYVIRIGNLPEPLPENILVSSNNRLLDNRQKTDLCGAIAGARIDTSVLREPYIDIQLDFINEKVAAEIC